MKQKMKRSTVTETQIVKVEKDELQKSLDIPGMIQTFLDAQDIKEISKATYAQGLQRFLRWCEANQIKTPIRQDILKFKYHLKKQDLSINTCNLYLTATKRFFVFIHSEYGYPDITRNVAGYKTARGHLREAFTRSQIEEILSKIDCSTIKGKRNYALVALLASTGLRCISVVNADLGDLKPQGKEAKLFYLLKGRDEKDEKALILENPLKKIMCYIKARGKVRPEDPLFCSHSDRNPGQRLNTRTLRNVVNDLLKELGITDPRLSAHSFRHYFASDSIANGADILSVSKALGHSSIETTMIYVHQKDRFGDGAAERFVNFEMRVNA